MDRSGNRVYGQMEQSPIGRPRRQLTTSEAIVARSSDAPPGMLDPPGTDAFPAAAPHSVTPYGRPRWASGMARWWRGIFRRNPYGRAPDGVRSGRGGRHFFQHLIEPDGEAASGPPARD